MEVHRVRKEQPTHPYQHSLPQQVVLDSNLACPYWAGSQPDILHPDTPTPQVQRQQNKRKVYPRCRHWQRLWPRAYSHQVEADNRALHEVPSHLIWPGDSQNPKIAEVFQAKVAAKFEALCVLDSYVDTLRTVWTKGYSQHLKRSLGDKGRFNLGSQARIWNCATRDCSWNNRSTLALKQDCSTEKWAERSGRKWR